MDFNHFDEQGRAHMVDVSGKDETLREASAEAIIRLGTELLTKVTETGLQKGDVFGVARLAGIGAAKKTSDLIPLAHPLAMHHAAVDFQLEMDQGTVRAICTVKAVDRTGVEMEAMTGAMVAAMTIYDMCKGQDRSLEVGPVRLIHKSGGRSGVYERAGEEE